MPSSIIDSHIHLYAQTHLSSLNWTASLPTTHILNAQHSVSDYKADTNNDPDLRGFIFVETDRKSGLDEQDWSHALNEIAFLIRIVAGRPVADEGHAINDSRLLLGIVAWAPVLAGPTGLEKYVAKVRQVCGEVFFPVIKGFRYLLQDKEQGTMMDSRFIAGLQWLGSRDFVFDLGVDVRSGGMWQLQEACEMLDRVYDGGHKLKVVINHLCKPNLRLGPDETRKSEEFQRWKQLVQRMAGFEGTYMKLSGLFSELPHQNEGEAEKLEVLLERVKPWTDVVFDCFGPRKIMFGSDWPVCNVGGPGTASWRHWCELVGAVLDERRLSEAEKTRIWSGTVIEAYDVKL